MRQKHFVFLLSFVLLSYLSNAQKTKPAVDSLAYYDDLFNELESFLDSITAPRSFANISLGINNGYFNYQSQSSIESSSKLVYTPSLGYYHKSGFGIGATGSAIADGFKNINLFQIAATASYDYMQSSQFLTGVAYTQFFTKDSLDFYTSPLTSEASGYFLYRNSWLKPSIAVNYAWGSRTHVEERQEKIKLLRGKPLNSTTIIETTENVSDLSVALSVKHDFYWLNVLLDKDYFRFSPQISLISGTQRFGFNQVSNANYFNSKSGISVLQNTEELNLSESSKFKPLSLSARLRTEFSTGKFFFQPQILLDYYFPAEEKNFTTGFAITTGFIL